MKPISLLGIFFRNFVLIFIFSAIVMQSIEMGGVRSILGLVLTLSADLAVLRYRNPLIFKYTDKYPDWMTSRQIFIGVCAIAMMAIGAVVVAFPFGDSDSFKELGRGVVIAIHAGAFVISILSALVYSHLFMKNMPEDPIAYEAAIKDKEDAETWTVVAEFNESRNAHAVKEMLESHGLEVYLYGDNAPAHLGAGTSHLMKILLCVRRRDKETAERLVNE